MDDDRLEQEQKTEKKGSWSDAVGTERRKPKKKKKKKKEKKSNCCEVKKRIVAAFCSFSSSSSVFVVLLPDDFRLISPFQTADSNVKSKRRSALGGMAGRAPLCNNNDNSRSIEKEAVD